MIGLELIQSETIPTEKQQKYQHYNQGKLKNINIL